MAGERGPRLDYLVKLQRQCLGLPGASKRQIALAEQAAGPIGDAVESKVYVSEGGNNSSPRHVYAPSKTAAGSFFLYGVSVVFNSMTASTLAWEHASTDPGRSASGSCRGRGFASNASAIAVASVAW
jgi:hypothetical protein